MRRRDVTRGHGYNQLGTLGHPYPVVFLREDATRALTGQGCPRVPSLFGVVLGTERPGRKVGAQSGCSDEFESPQLRHQVACPLVLVQGGCRHCHPWLAVRFRRTGYPSLCTEFTPSWIQEFSEVCS